MATSTFRNKNLVRPIKRGKARRQRIASQHKRLLALGVPESELRKMTVVDVRAALRRPKATAAKYA